MNSGSTFKQWNKGVRLAQGKYVWIAESDDYADEKLLECLVAVLERDEKIAFAYCRSWRVMGERSDRWLYRSFLHLRPSLEFGLLRGWSRALPEILGAFARNMQR